MYSQFFPRQSKGFTYIELIVVISILSITILFPVYYLLRKASEQNEPETLKQLFLNGSNSSIYKQSLYCIQNDTLDGHVKLLICSDELNCGVLVSTLKLKSGNKIRFFTTTNTSTSQICFDHNGATTTGLPFTITYVPKKGIQKKFKVIASIGQLLEVQ